MAMVQAEEEDSTMVVEDMEEDPATTAVDPMEMVPPSRPHTSSIQMEPMLKDSSHSRKQRSVCWRTYNKTKITMKYQKS